MGGAPITITLYRNGIHVTYSRQPLIHDPALASVMRKTLDAGESVEALLWGGPLTPLLDQVDVAIDCFYVQDKRDEMYEPPPAAPEPARAGKKKKKR